jgi:ABC-type transport system involved in multi-copper enzyme maturation permease subunit
MSAVYLLTLRQLTGKWRLAIMTILALLPVLIAALMLRSAHAPSLRDFETSVLSAMLAGSISQLIVLAIGAAAFANEVEDKTLANLTLSPVPRWQIALPKLLATFTIAAPFIAASAFATSYIAYLGDLKAVVAVMTAAVVGVALYASAFVWLGLVSTQAIGIGLLYIVLWEGFFAGFVSGARLLSIRYYTIGLMHALDARRFAFSTHLGAALVSAICVAVFGGFLVLSIRRLRRMDVP